MPGVRKKERVKETEDEIVTQRGRKWGKKEEGGRKGKEENRQVETQNMKKTDQCRNRRASARNAEK